MFFIRYFCPVLVRMGPQIQTKGLSLPANEMGSIVGILVLCAEVEKREWGEAQAIQIIHTKAQT